MSRVRFPSASRRRTSTWREVSFPRGRRREIASSMEAARRVTFCLRTRSSTPARKHATAPAPVIDSVTTMSGVAGEMRRMTSIAPRASNRVDENSERTTSGESSLSTAVKVSCESTRLVTVDIPERDKAEEMSSASDSLSDSSRTRIGFVICVGSSTECRTLGAPERGNELPSVDCNALRGSFAKYLGAQSTAIHREQPRDNVATSDFLDFGRAWRFPRRQRN